MSKTPYVKSDRVAAFRNQYDKSVIVPAKIEAALKKLGDDWRGEEDFRRECGLCQVDFAKYREQFTDFMIEVREPGKGAKRVWCGTKALAEELRDHANK